MNEPRIQADLEGDEPQVGQAGEQVALPVQGDRDPRDRLDPRVEGLEPLGQGVAVQDRVGVDGDKDVRRVIQEGGEMRRALAGRFDLDGVGLDALGSRPLPPLGEQPPVGLDGAAVDDDLDPFGQAASRLGASLWTGTLTVTRSRSTRACWRLVSRTGRSRYARAICQANSRKAPTYTIANCRAAPSSASTKATTDCDAHATPPVSSNSTSSTAGRRPAGLALMAGGITAWPQANEDYVCAAPNTCSVPSTAIDGRGLLLASCPDGRSADQGTGEPGDPGLRGVARSCGCQAVSTSMVTGTPLVMTS